MKIEIDNAVDTHRAIVKENGTVAGLTKYAGHTVIVVVMREGEK